MLEFTFFNKGYDGRGRGGFVPPDGPSGPPSHDMLNKRIHVV